jgi:nitrous oxidase accessory protein NosD
MGVSAPKGFGRVLAVLVVLGCACVFGVGAAGAWPGHAALWVSATKGDDANACSRVAPCATIGHAVSVADPTQTVIVLPGTYAETVTVDKQIVLVGVDATIDATKLVNGVVIEGSDAAGTILRGFTVENAIGEGILAQGTSKLTIARNTVANNDQGAGTDATPECADHGQVPGDCGEGLHLMSVTDSRVVGNDVEHNVGGILVTDEQGPASGNLIAENVSRDNAADCGITLPSHNPDAVSDPSKGGVYDNTVIHNVSIGNGGAGVGMFAPFPGAASYGNRVIGNTLLNNGEAGIAIHSHAPGQDVSKNVIVANVVAGNGVDPDSGSGHPTGIALFTAADQSDAVVAANEISDEYWGIFIAGPFTVDGLDSNSFSSTVTNPIGHP